MLLKFEVKNFRNFKEWFCLDLTKSKQYGFNSEALQDGVINHAIIYGVNGGGKSNLGLALVDITSHLTDTKRSRSLQSNYLNASSGDVLAEFKYLFKFGDSYVTYEYGKESHEITVYEKLYINDKLSISIDRRRDSRAVYNLGGAEDLKSDLSNSTISAAKYLDRNAVLDDDPSNNAFKQMMTFVHGMVFFRSVRGHEFYGQDIVDVNRLSEKILNNGLLDDFERFLNDAGVVCSLTELNLNGERCIAFKFDNRNIEFSQVASTGTVSLGQFYYWWLKLRDGSLKFAYLDEFDAFYHHRLAKMIVQKVKSVDCQTLMTTHNTSIMTNDLLRPDCYFELNKTITQFNDMTNKELRQAHNLEKIYKSLSA
ncbi:SMC domain-containing protein [Oleiphilus messinensis]|uniref:SMC domain-containing protein n=1 Tax=Oleiphilus messinensis TaxID=141451 RepID=A0A1Y0IBJ8_9GAMM|nr:AAA family ATPase [Oleiphilus messinensis]ARU57912.1 SMC domain-containing protein [Oleiphilus messinensis]